VKRVEGGTSGALAAYKGFREAREAPESLLTVLKTVMRGSREPPNGVKDSYERLPRAS